VKEFGSASVGSKPSRQQLKGSKPLPEVHIKASIFIMDTPGHFSSQLSLAKEFAELGFETLALINNAVLAEFLELMRGQGYVAPAMPKPASQLMLTRFIPTRQKVLSMGNTWNFFRIPSLEKEKSKFNQAQIQNLDYTSTWKRISRANKSSIFVWPEFNFFYGHLGIFRTLTKAKISQAIYTYTLVNEEEWKVAFGKSVARTRDGLVNRIIDLAFPAWTRFSGGKKIRLPIQFPIAATLAQYHTYNPWLAGANLSIPIFTPDSFTFRYLQGAGYDSIHLHIGGMTGGEKLIKTRQSILNQKVNSKGRKPLVLVALPPDQTSDESGLEFRNLIKSTILDPASRLDELANVQFVLHPRLGRATRTWVESLGLKITQGELPPLIASSNLYVACASATLRVAESLGVPALNYDVYRLGYGDFEGAKCVETTETPSQFERLIRNKLKQSEAHEIDMAIGINPVEALLRSLPVRILDDDK
jgi:hypothetical protein